MVHESSIKTLLLKARMSPGSTCIKRHALFMRSFKSLLPSWNVSHYYDMYLKGYLPLVMDRLNITACVLSVCTGTYVFVYPLNERTTQVAEQSGCQSPGYASVLCPSPSKNYK